MISRAVRDVSISDIRVPFSVCIPSERTSVPAEELAIYFAGDVSIHQSVQHIQLRPSWPRLYALHSDHWLPPFYPTSLPIRSRRFSQALSKPCLSCVPDLLSAAHTGASEIDPRAAGGDQLYATLRWNRMRLARRAPRGPARFPSVISTRGYAPNRARLGSQRRSVPADT